jgi:hypothetical protein
LHCTAIFATIATQNYNYYMANKQDKEEKPKMVTTSLRIEEAALEELRIKSKPANPSIYLRILAKMWLDGRIEISGEDIQKYS